MQFRCEFGQRHQNESATGHARVWKFNFRPSNNVRAVKKDIEIDDAGAARDQSFPAEIPLDSLQRVEQVARHEQSLPLHDAVQEPRLRLKIQRLGFIQRRSPKNAHTCFGQSRNGAFEVRGAVAKIRTEGEVDSFSVRHIEE